MTGKDTAFEWVTGRKETAAHKRNRILCVIAFFVFLILGILKVTILFLGPLIVWAVLAIYMYRNRDIEYEYNYSMGEFSVYRIANSVRRKQLFFCTLDEILYAVKGADEHRPVLSYYYKGDRVYTLQVSNERGQNGVLIEMDTRFLEVLKQQQKVRGTAD